VFSLASLLTLNVPGEYRAEGDPRIVKIALLVKVLTW